MFKRVTQKDILVLYYYFEFENIKKTRVVDLNDAGNLSVCYNIIYYINDILSTVIKVQKCPVSKMIYLITMITLKNIKKNCQINYQIDTIFHYYVFINKKKQRCKLN